MKKFISRVLICAMLISVLPKTNFADEEKVKSEAVKKEETAKNEKTEKNAEKKETKVDKKEEAKTEKKLEKPIATNPIKARATENRYKVTFSFVSETEGKDLPAEVLGLKPADKTDVEPGTNINLPKPANVDVAEGTWYFTGWNKKSGQSTIPITNDHIQVDNQDLELIGTWTFRANPNPEKYNVTYKFVSDTESAEIPQDVLDKKPADQTDVPAGTNIPLENLGEVIVPEGTWHFVKWTAKIGEATIDLQDSIQVDNQDLEIVGHWRFEENPPLKKHTVFYVFESGTEGKDLPQEVMDKKPADNPNALNGSPVQIFNIEDVEVPDGTWKLEGWYREVEGERKLIDSEVMVEDEDITVYGVWKFTEKAKKYNVEFSFYSVTKGKELPDEIKAKLPANKTDVLNGTEIPLPNYEDVKVKGGTWKFLGWYSIKGAEHNKVENKVVVDNDNLYLLGQWKFEADKKPQPKPHKPKVQKGRILPKTNVESAFTYVVLALAGIGGAYIAKKKDNE